MFPEAANLRSVEKPSSNYFEYTKRIWLSLSYLLIFSVFCEKNVYF